MPLPGSIRPPPRVALDPDVQLDGDPIAGRARPRRELARVAVAEDHVRVERDLGEVARALLVAVGLVDRVAQVLRQSDLRGPQLRARRRGGVEALVDLEVHVRPAPRVGGREDALEDDLPVAAALLDAAQVVLGGDLLVVHRVAAVDVAMPQVDGRASERLAAARHVEEGHLDSGGHAGGRAGSVAEALRDVPAHDPALREGVWAVGPVARERPRRLLRYLGGRAPTLRRSGGRGVPAAVRRAARGQRGGAEAAREDPEGAPAADQPRQVVGEAEIVFFRRRHRAVRIARSRELSLGGS